ncbi:MAG: YceI family protein [Thermoanaerobaculia bacterium]
MRRILAIAFAGLALASLLPAQPADAAGVREFRVDDAWGRDTVQFSTSAPVEDIVGTTNQLIGVLRADPKNLRGPGTSVRLEVPVASIKTGIEMRDGAVARALGGEKSPRAVFTLEHVLSASASTLEPNAAVDITAGGTLELKGVQRKIEVAARITSIPKGGPFSQMRPGNFVKLVARFDIKLADFGVERGGSVLPLQVGETAHVTVTALASDASPEEAEGYRKKAVQYMGKAVN